MRFPGDFFNSVEYLYFFKKPIDFFEKLDII